MAFTCWGQGPGWKPGFLCLSPGPLVLCPMEGTAFCPSAATGPTDYWWHLPPQGSGRNVFQSGAELALWVWCLIWGRPLRSRLATHYNWDSCGSGQGSL